MTISSNASTAAQSAAAAAGGASATSAANSASNAVGTQSAFLQLLVTQMQNQDPLNPMDNSQITSQLAQISTVDGITTLNTSVQQLVSNNNTTQTIAAASMLGTTVLVPGSSMSLSQNQAVYGINLPQAASSVQVTITDSSGNLVNTLSLGAQPTGVTALSWNGTTASGATAAAGTYNFSVTAVQGSTSVTATGLTGALVQGVVQGTNGPQLNLGAAGTVPISSVQQIL